MIYRRYQTPNNQSAPQVHNAAAQSQPQSGNAQPRPQPSAPHQNPPRRDQGSPPRQIYGGGGRQHQPQDQGRQPPPYQYSHPGGWNGPDPYAQYQPAPNGGKTPPQQGWQPEYPPPQSHGGGGQGQRKRKRNPLLSFIPPSLYNPETKKVLGFLSTEDLLLVALILLFLENEENNDPMIVYALIYVLISDYIDLGGLLNL